MANRDALESREELMEVARELGISERQVRRWRSEGLLPKLVDQAWHGRGMGSATFYPAGSCRQLREVARWFERDRRVDVVRWVLWCNGFAVEPDPHARIVEALRRRSGRADAENAEQDTGDYVAVFAAMLRTAAEAAKRLEPADGRDLGSLLGKITQQQGASGAPSVGPLLPVELDRMFAEALRSWDLAALEKYLTPDRLLELRDRAGLFYRLWAPERAANEPLPPRILIAMIVLNAIGIPIGVVVDYLIHDPVAGEAGRKLRDWLLDDSVWRKPRARTA